MDEARKGEIAVKVLVYVMMERGAHFGPSLMEKLKRFSEQSGIPIDEVKAFSKSIVNEVTEKLFTPTATTTPPQSE